VTRTCRWRAILAQFLFPFVRQCFGTVRPGERFEGVGHVEAICHRSNGLRVARPPGFPSSSASCRAFRRRGTTIRSTASRSSWIGRAGAARSPPWSSASTGDDCVRSASIGRNGCRDGDDLPLNRECPRGLGHGWPVLLRRSSGAGLEEADGDPRHRDHDGKADSRRRYSRSSEGCPPPTGPATLSPTAAPSGLHEQPLGQTRKSESQRRPGN
jgi:hypothetical protein